MGKSGQLNGIVFGADFVTIHNGDTEDVEFFVFGVYCVHKHRCDNFKIE